MLFEKRGRNYCARRKTFQISSTRKDGVAGAGASSRSPGGFNPGEPGDVSPRIGEAKTLNPGASLLRSGDSLRPAHLESELDASHAPSERRSSPLERGPDDAVTLTSGRNGSKFWLRIVRRSPHRKSIQPSPGEFGFVSIEIHCDGSAVILIGVIDLAEIPKTFASTKMSRGDVNRVGT